MSQSEAARTMVNGRRCLSAQLQDNQRVSSSSSPLSTGLHEPRRTLYPTRHQLADVLTAHQPSLCFLEISEPPERSLELITELLRVDPKLPIVGVLSGNDPELVLRCLRQGASDFLIQPFTIDQVDAALQKMARLHPGRTKIPAKCTA